MADNKLEDYQFKTKGCQKYGKANGNLIEMV